MAIETTNGLPVLTIHGQRRILAAKRPDRFAASNFKSFSSIQSALPRSQWVARDYRNFGSPTKDQGQHGSCSGHAGVKAFDVGRRIAGMPNIALSSTFPYSQLNGGRDNGASVSDNMLVLMRTGTCLESTCGVDQIFTRQIPRTATQEAANYKLQEAYVLRTFDDFGTALTLGYTAAIGIMIGENFARLDANGIAPLPVTTIGGHAMGVVGLAKINGQWVLLLQNSWGSTFGFGGGFCYITESHTTQMLDGFAVIVPKESPASGDDEPPVVPEKNKIIVPSGFSTSDKLAEIKPSTNKPVEPAKAAVVEPKPSPKIEKPAAPPLPTPSIDEIMAGRKAQVDNILSKKSNQSDEASKPKAEPAKPETGEKK